MKKLYVLYAKKFKLTQRLVSQDESEMKIGCQHGKLYLYKQRRVDFTLIVLRG